MAEQLSLWSVLPASERGFELRGRWGPWLPAYPGSVLRAQFEVFGPYGLREARLLGDGQELWFRRAAGLEAPCVWVSDGLPGEGGMRLVRVPGQRPTRWEVEQSGSGGWRVDLVPGAGSVLEELGPYFGLGPAFRSEEEVRWVYEQLGRPMPSAPFVRFLVEGPADPPVPTGVAPAPALPAPIRAVM